MENYIGTMLDNRYELLEIIGVGGTAVVYKAKCHRLNRYVAVKILRSEFAKLFLFVIFRLFILYLYVLRQPKENVQCR